VKNIIVDNSRLSPNIMKVDGNRTYNMWIWTCLIMGIAVISEIYESGSTGAMAMSTSKQARQKLKSKTNITMRAEEKQNRYGTIRIVYQI
jgi:hypothetical protein